MTQFQYSNNCPLLARDLENSLDLDILSSMLFDDDDDDDLIPILDREDDSDLSRPDSSRCSSLSALSSEWICPLKDCIPPFNYLLANDTYQLPRAPPPTPLPTSPNVLPRCQNELHLEVPSFVLSTSLKEIGVCAAMGNPVFIRRSSDSRDFNVEEDLSCDDGQMLKSLLGPPCTSCNGTAGFHSQAAFDNQKLASSEENRDLEQHLYQFPSLTSCGHPCCTPSTPPPSICSESSFDNDPEKITWHSFLRQPYTMVEIDYQLQLLSIQQKVQNSERAEPSFVSLKVAGGEHHKRGIRLRNKSLSSLEKCKGTLGKRISRAIKRSLSR